MSDNGFRFGDWQINPDTNTLCQGTTTSQVEPKAMDVLRYLCRHPGAVIPPEELLQACWGNAELGDNPIHKAITQLRRALGDSASDPRYIETVRKRGYRAIAPVMSAEDLQEGSWQQGSPFRGLESFQESHASIFFGRLQATAQLRELVLNRASDGCAMALVLGPSGSGKTSLVRAGLLPRLMASRTGSGEPVALACTLYMDCADLADGNLFQALAAVLIDAEINGKLVFDGENAEGLGHWLESSDAATIAGRLAEVAGKIKIGVFVDRLEAIFRAPGVTDEIRARFIAVLEYLASSRAVLVILACRNDFYPEVIALPTLMALKARGGHFDLNPPDGAEIAQMVRMPAKAAGLKFEVDPATGAALDDVLCDAARGSPDTLPLLQYCLNELYRQRGEDGTLRFEVFRQLGGIEGAIAVRAEEVVSGLSAAQAGALPHVLSLIVDVAEQQGAVTARRAAWSTLSNSEARELVQALVEARLFVSELSGDIPSFGIAHEALLRRWPRVSEWIELHRHALQLRTRISQEAEKWAVAGKPRDLLLPPGSRVNQARELLNLKGFSVPEQLQEYIHSSQQRAKFSERLRMFVTVLICVLAVLAVGLGLMALQAQKTAEKRRADAESLMTYMLGDFVEKLRPLGKLELLNDVSGKALAYLSETTSTSMTATTMEQRAKALQVIAEIDISRSSSDKAYATLLLSKEILRKLDTPEHINASILKSLGANAFWIGNIHFNRHEWKQAEDNFNQYRIFSERFSAFPDVAEQGFAEQAYALNSLGSVAIRRGDAQQSVSYFEKAAALMLKATQISPTNQKLQADLAHIYSWLADAKTRLGNLRDAMDLYKKEHQQLKILLKDDPQNLLLKRRLAVALWREGDLQIALGNDSDGLTKLIEAEQYHKDLLINDPSNDQWRIRSLSLTLKRIEAASGSKPATELLEELNALRVELDKLNALDNMQIEVKQLIAATERVQASLSITAEKKLEAEHFINDSLAILMPIYKKDVKSQRLSIDISRALIEKSNLQRSVHDLKGMINSCRLAIDILKPFSESTMDYRLLAILAAGYACLSNEEDTQTFVDKLKKMSYNESRFARQMNVEMHLTH